MAANLVQLDFAAPITAASPAIASAVPSTAPFTSVLSRATGADLSLPPSAFAPGDAAAARKKTPTIGTPKLADARPPIAVLPDRTASGTLADAVPVLTFDAPTPFLAMPVQTSNPAISTASIGTSQTDAASAAGGSAHFTSAAECAPVPASAVEPVSATQFACSGSNRFALAEADAVSTPIADVMPALATPAPDSTAVPAGSHVAACNVLSTAPNGSTPKPESTTLADPARDPGLDPQPAPLTQTTQPLLSTENEMPSAASDVPAVESAARFLAMPAKLQPELGNSGIRIVPLVSSPALHTVLNVTLAAEPATVTNPVSRTASHDHPGFGQAHAAIGAQDSDPTQVTPASGKFAGLSSSEQTSSETPPRGPKSARGSSISGNQDDSSLNASLHGNPDPRSIIVDPDPQTTSSQPTNATAPESLGNALPLETQEAATQNPSPPTVEHPALPAAENAPAQPISTGPVQLARMVNGISQSEMHIGFRTQAFGSVEVHTVVRESQLGLTVGSEKGNLRTFLSSEVPILQTTFRQHDLRLEDIRFLENCAGFGADLSGGANQHSRPFRQSSASTTGGLPPEDAQGSPPEETISIEENTKLSVLA